MKKRFASGLILLLMVMMLAVPAFAAQYASTQSFINVLEENGFVYSYGGIDSDNDEKVTVSFDSEEPYDECKFYFYFSDEDSMVQLRMWNLLKVSVDETTACKILNDVNFNYKWTKFVYDESDSTITMKMDIPFTDDNAGEVVFRMMKNAIQVLMQEYAKEAFLSLK